MLSVSQRKSLRQVALKVFDLLYVVNEGIVESRLKSPLFLDCLLIGLRELNFTLEEGTLVALLGRTSLLFCEV